MLPGQIGLLLAGLLSALVLGLMGWRSYTLHKKEQAKKARRARRQAPKVQAASAPAPDTVPPVSAPPVQAAPPKEAPTAQSTDFFFDDVAHEKNEPKDTPSFTSAADLDWSFLDDIPSDQEKKDDDAPPVSFDFKF